MFLNLSFLNIIKAKIPIIKNWDVARRVFNPYKILFGKGGLLKVTEPVMKIVTPNPVRARHK